MYAHSFFSAHVTRDALPLTGGTPLHPAAAPVLATPVPRRLGNRAATALPSLTSNAASGRWALVHDAGAPQTARSLLAPVLHEWLLLGGTADDVLLVVSELVTNAVRHARPPIFLAICRTEARSVRVEITDGGKFGDPRCIETPDDPDEHGRGLIIVDCLSAAHGCRVAEHGTTWWAEFIGDR
ncbi:ATP-binding protein [Streptomyces sp. NPDC050549]|uniref:ATP-binding protein n=1 Tax=Streptomyces sp. NPDC050549 TaxID=3155406 RepID=UPI0034181E43